MIPSTKLLANNNAKIMFSSLHSVGKHYYYRNSAIKPIYFLNIPKNASSYIKNLMHFIDNPNTESKSFCIVRDPLERFISIYKYMVNVEEKFDEFFNAFFYDEDLSKENYIKVGVEHLMPQSFFVENAPSQWKTQCQLITMDDFFADGADSGLRQIGLRTRISLPNSKENPSEYPSGYKDWLMNKIYQSYSEIFDTYLSQDFDLYQKAKNKEVLAS